MNCVLFGRILYVDSEAFKATEKCLDKKETVCETEVCAGQQMLGNGLGNMSEGGAGRWVGDGTGSGVGERMGTCHHRPTNH